METSTLLCLTLLSVIISLIYKWWQVKAKFFDTKGIDYVKPIFLLGSTGSMLWKRQSLVAWADEVYNAFPNKRIFGLYDFTTPLYMIRDPELIKRIAVKEFDHFENHKTVMDEKLDPLLGNALTALRGQKWRDMRATLSPAFTGSKMRQMFQLVGECGEQSSDYIDEQTKINDIGEFEMKDLFSRFANDVIASCAFGIKVNSLKVKDNEFFKTGKDIMHFTKPSKMFKLLLIRATPSIAKFLSIKVVSTEITHFFRSLILDTLKIRDKENIIRPDMINIIMQYKKGQLVQDEHNVNEKNDAGFATVTEANIGRSHIKSEWTDDQLVAQCLLFFLAGFDTSSTLLTFAAYELAMNKNVELKLINEVDRFTEQLSNGKKITYDILQSMKYMDNFISETLRMWPPAVITDRQCNKEYLLELDKNIQLKIEKNTSIWIPIYGLHHDPNYFPQPNVFDPDRFNEENVDKIVPGTYLPFGVGPRNCIGSRFALMEIKVVLFYILQKFTFNICEKTTIPLQKAVGPFRILPAKGLTLALKRRIGE